MYIISLKEKLYDFRHQISTHIKVTHCILRKIA